MKQLLSFMIWMCLSVAMAGAKHVTYEQFGAKGDGAADDLPAIVAAHAYANQHGLEVRAKDGATYYIGGRDLTAVVETDTTLGTARFIIDDRKLERRGAWIYEIRSRQPSFVPQGITRLKRNQERLEIPVPSDCLVVVTDDSVRRYVRRGINRNRGSYQTDAFIVRRDGSIDMSSPIIWDFERISDIRAYPIDRDRLTFAGGVFTTLANQFEGTHLYVSRGIAVRRSNVLVKDIVHYVKEEGTASFPYNGFLNVGNSADVTCENCLLTGHRVFSFKAPKGQATTTGTYDIICYRSLNVTFVNCRQTNDIHDRQFWGIMGSNFCKNLTYESCVLSRFDAHQGVANATIRNSVLGHQGVNAIGFGTLTLENTTVSSWGLINFRSDYGSSWNGRVVIRNCVYKPTSPKNVSLFRGSNDGAHDFGYECRLPEVFDIDGLLVKDGAETEGGGLRWFATFNQRLHEPGYKERFPLVRPKKMVLSKVRTESGRAIGISWMPAMFKDVAVERR